MQPQLELGPVGQPPVATSSGGILLVYTRYIPYTGISFGNEFGAMEEFLSGDFCDAGDFSDGDFGYYSGDDGSCGCPNVFLALRVTLDGRVQCLTQLPDRFAFGELSDSDLRCNPGPGVCRYCSRRVYDEGRPAGAGSETLHYHEFWDHLDPFEEVLELEAAAKVAKGGRRRGKRGKEAKRMAKRTSAESDQGGTTDQRQQLQQLSSDIYAPGSCPQGPATTCPPIYDIFGHPILSFRLDPPSLGSSSS